MTFQSKFFLGKNVLLILKGGGKFFFSLKLFSLSAGILLDKPKVPSESLEAHVEPELISAVTKLLDDRNPQVRVAAAITLYSLKKHNDNVSTYMAHIWQYPPRGVLKIYFGRKVHPAS